MSEKCCPRADVVSTHWEGCHTIHPECAAWRAGREAGLREAAGMCEEKWEKWHAEYGGNTAFDAAYISALQGAASAILAAIGEGK